MDASSRAFLDASVLYPVTLRNFLMRLALNDLFQARWSEDVHKEWIRSVHKDRPDIPMSRLRAVADAMNENAEQSLVIGHEGLIGELTLPDPDDRHVLAGAITGEAKVIVTFNLRDFPGQILDPYGIEAQHPDEFILRLLHLSPELVAGALREQQAALMNPPVAMGEILQIFKSIGLTKTVAGLKRILG